MRKFIKFIADLLIIALLLLVCAISIPKFLKIQPLTVLSGSMEPAYHVGSLVYVRETKADQIQVGDTITFHLNEDTMVTHRVVSKDEESQSFKTKGDANNVEDSSAVAYEQVVGKVIFNIPYLGYAASFLSTKTGFITLVSVIILALIISFIPDVVSKGSKEDEMMNHDNEALENK